MATKAAARAAAVGSADAGLVRAGPERPLERGTGPERPLERGTGSSSGTAPNRRVRLVSRPLIVLPTYQEADNITDVLRRVRASVPDAGVLVVDDSSPDGTAAMARAMGDELGSIDVLVRPQKSGLGQAYRAGFHRGLDEG